MKLQIINGPNLNLIGRREKSIYGVLSFDDYLDYLLKKYPQLTIDYFQSNIEGEIIDKIQEVGYSYDGIILNAAAYTHTSVGIADAISFSNTKKLKKVFNEDIILPWVFALTLFDCSYKNPRTISGSIKLNFLALVFDK